MTTPTQDLREQVELLPCPHCGEPNELYQMLHGFGGGKPYGIDCLGCGSEFIPREGVDVIAAWNRRTPPLSPGAGVVEALASADSWLDRWASHVGSCRGGFACECGLTAIKYEVQSALRQAKDPTHD